MNGLSIVVIALVLCSLVTARAQGQPGGTPCGPLPVNFKANEMRTRITHREPLRINETNVKINPDSKLSFGLIVDADSAVTCLHLLRGHPLLAASAIESLKHWRFRPLVKSGKTVPYSGTLVLKGREFL
jgi:hypothetical protein